MKTVILQAPLYSASGYGDYSREIFRALLLHTPFKVVGLPTKWGVTTEPLLDDSEFSKALKLACSARPDQGEEDMIFIQVAQAGDFTPFERCINIGITRAVEADKIPQSYVDAALKMDALIVSSTFARDQFLAAGMYENQIAVVNEGVDLSIFQPTRLGSINFPTSFNFMCGGQWNGNSPQEQERKGIGEVIATFLDTFPDSEEVGLVVKSHTYNNGSSDEFLTQKKIEILKGGKDFPRVYLIHGHMTDPEMNDLYNSVEVFVSATHGEAGGRMIAEAAATNLPLIVTGFGAQMDFVDPKKATILSFNMQTPKGVKLPEGAKWAQASQADLKRYMLRAHRKYAGAVIRATQLGDAVRARFGTDTTSHEFAAALQQIIRGAK